MITEVNMNVASYIKFDDITNAFVEVKPTKLAATNSFASEEEQPGSKQAHNGVHPLQLDTSFDLHLALNNALDKLQAGSQSSQQTPALGKSNNYKQDSSLLSNDTFLPWEKLQAHNCYCYYLLYS